MRFRKLRDRIHVGAVLGSLLLIYTVFLSGCVWVPDFTHPSPNPALNDPLAGSIIKKMPFSVTRTFLVEKDGSIKAEFNWEKMGRAVWFEEFGFGNAAAQWRFVLFGPDGKIICGNKWTDTSKDSTTCDLKKEHTGTPLSADIDFRREKREPTDELAPFESVGRVFIFIERKEVSKPK